MAIQTLAIDEAGHAKQQWTDGFGRIIEVDEPSSNSPATPSTGSSTITSGGEQSSTVGTVAGTGSVTIDGYPQSVSYMYDPCSGYDPSSEDYLGCWANYGPPYQPYPVYTYDYGTVYITVNGVTGSTSYNSSDSSATVASRLATAVTNYNSYAWASASGSTIYLYARTLGASTNYSFSVSGVSSDTYDFPSPSFYGTPANSALTGGASTTLYDAGTVSLTIGGVEFYTTYDQNTSPTAVATVLANAINSNSSLPVAATATGGTLNLKATALGSATNYSMAGYSVSNYPGTFSTPSFHISVSGNGSMTGGQDPNFSSANATLYTYDALDNLTQVIQGAQTRTFAYDGLSRLTQETTPEAGTITLSYTNGGALCSGDPSNVCQKTAPTPNQYNSSVTTTTYCYDALGRITQKGFTAQACPMASPAVAYTYDQGGAAAGALGRLTQMVDSSGLESYTYDTTHKTGRITQVQKTIGTTTYTTSYLYDAAGDLTQITYPSGRVVQQSYNAIGQLCAVAASTTTCGSSSSPYATGYSYNAAGQVTGFNYGNGVAGNFSYTGNRSQLASLSYTKSGSTLFSQNYFYQYDGSNCAAGAPGNNGEIDCITDGVDAGRTLNYTYDILGRLNTAQTNGSAAYPPWGLSETYDQYGNRRCQTVTAGSGPGAGCNTYTNNRPSGFTFDAAGDMTVEPLGPPNNYTFDAQNRLVGMSGNGGVATYTYDDNDQRVKKAMQGGTATVYIFSGDKVIAEYDNGALPGSPSREYIYGGGALLAKIESGATRYYHQDHLSVRLMTDASGNKIGEQGHYPFGEAWYANSTTTNWQFTTYERDSESA